MTRVCSPLVPASFAQTFEHVGVVFRPHPRYTTPDIRLERARYDRDGPLQRFLRLFEPTELAERGGEPTVRVGKIGERPDRAFCHPDSGRIIPTKIKSECQLVQTDCLSRLARVEPDAPFESRDTFLRASRKDQRRAAHVVGKS